MLNPLENVEIMKEVVEYLSPSFMEANKEFADKCRIKMITFVPFHTDNDSCEHCAVNPVACLRCIATLFPPSNQEVKDASDPA